MIATTLCWIGLEGFFKESPNWRKNNNNAKEKRNLKELLGRGWRENRKWNLKNPSESERILKVTSRRLQRIKTSIYPTPLNYQREREREREREKETRKKLKLSQRVPKTSFKKSSGILIDSQESLEKLEIILGYAGNFLLSSRSWQLPENTDATKFSRTRSLEEVETNLKTSWKNLWRNPT